MSFLGMQQQMARELAPYQGCPPHEPVVPGDPNWHGRAPHAAAADAGTDENVAEVYRPTELGGRPVALSESTPEAGGVLIPPTWAGARRRR